MSQRLSLPEVEVRVRAALGARSEDVVAPGASHRDASAPRPGPAANDRARAGGRWMIPAAAVALVAAAAGVAFVAHQAEDTVVSSQRDPDPGGEPATTDPPSNPGSAFTCGAELPVQVTVTGATTGPRAGPAPGSGPAADGQLVQHWLRPGGALEMRWPAPVPALYAVDEFTDRAPEAMSLGQTRGQVAIDFEPSAASHPTSTQDAFQPDLIVDLPPGQDHVGDFGAPCDVVEIATVTSSGRESTGLRVAGAGIASAYNLVDLQPRIVERRPVDAAPDAAIPCEGADQNGTPPNKSGGPDLTTRGAAPADVLLAYLAATPTASPSGYVEMTAPDGSITYGVDALGEGWTTLLFLTQDADGWYLAGWTASGC